MGRVLASTFCVLSVCACATGVETSPASTPPASDAAEDSANVLPDGESTDDASTPGEDAPADAFEASSDAPADTPTDSPVDVAASDDASDAALDTSEDQATADSPVDSPMDVTAEGEADTSPESGADAGPDGGADAAQESGADAAPESGCAVQGCDAGNESRAGCDHARVIGRKQAMGAGVTIVDNTCSAANSDDKADPACWDSAPDHTYRIYLRQGETLTVTLGPALSCNSGGWSTALKIYSSTGCNDTSCAAKDWCESPVTNPMTHPYTATHEGWVTLVVDGYSLYDTGTYELKAVLACNVPGCEC